MNPEKASKIALGYFKAIGRIPGERTVSRIIHGNRPAGLEREVFGLDFYNPVGLGAGLDVRGELYDDLNNLGFSFVEIGPLNAESTRNAVSNIQSNPPDDILACCIGSDYLTSMSLAYDFCDFFVIQVDDVDAIDSILAPLFDLRLAYEDYKPIVVKIPEDVSGDDLGAVLHYLRMNGADGIETRSLEQTADVAKRTLNRFPIIANTHISTPSQACDLLKAGASLIEIRSGLVKNGPGFVAKVLKHLENHVKKSGQDNR